MSERKIARLFKKIFAVLMTLVLVIGMNGNQTVLKVRAEGFGPSEDCPNFVELCYNNDGTIDSPTGISEADCYEENGMIRARTNGLSLSFKLIPAEGCQFLGLGWAETNYSVDDLTNGSCSFASYDYETQMLTIVFTETNKEYWGVDVSFGNEGGPGFGPTEAKPYFIEILTEGIGHVEVPEGYPTDDYFCDGNILQIRSANREIVVDVCTDDDPEVEHNITGLYRHYEEPTWDDAYDYEEITAGDCSWASYNAETKKLTFTLSETDMQFWGVFVTFEGGGPGFEPTEAKPYFIEILTEGIGHVEVPEGYPTDDYFCDGNMLQIRSDNPQIVVDVCTNDDPVVEHNITGLYRHYEEPTPDDAYDYEEITSGDCSWASYNAETKKLTFTLSETDKQFWGVFVTFEGGGPGGPSINVSYDNHNGGKVLISGPKMEGGTYEESELDNGPIGDFVFGGTYSFKLVPPENRTTGCSYIVEARIYNPGADPTVYTNCGSPSTLPIIDDTFTLTLPAEENFCGIDINIWWSEYDRIRGNENEYCFEVKNDGYGEAYLDGIGTSDYSTFWEYSKEDSETHEMIGYGSQKLIIPKNKIEGAVLRFAPYDGYSFSEYEIELPGQDPIRKEAKDFAEDQVPGYILSASDFDRDGNLHASVRFGSGNTPGPEPDGNNTPGEKLKGFIEEQKFLFGDWDGNSGVTTDDLKLGIAQQIFYPQFSDPRSRLRFQESYPEIDSYEKLVPGITIGERDSSKDITAIGGNGTQYTIPAYKYTFTFTDENNSDRNVNAEGIAWLFEITDTSVYATDSVTNVLMEVTNENGESTFFLRNCKRESPDCIDPVTKDPSGEGAYCAVGDYKVVFDAEKNAYVRSVSIFGNGASLDDFLMTEDSEIEMCTFQGKNIDIARDTGHLDCNIFGKFSFYQSSYTGMKIQGAGAAGNTPAWSFATDPIWGSDESSDTEKEAIVYFGNDQVAFKPITVNGVISKITDLSLVDTSIPAGVIDISPDGDTWYVEFNSNFYDKVEFAVTYETASGPKTEYIWVHRVGIDIQASNGGSAGGSTILMHGTENGPGYTFTETCETIVYATYYYPEDGGTDKLVDLYATITWKDGSVTKEIIRNDSHLHLDFHHDGLDGEHTDDVQSDDFILYKGSKAGAPQKIEVSAVVSGFESTTAFTGMRLGSGKGVCWNNNITN